MIFIPFLVLDDVVTITVQVSGNAENIVLVSLSHLRRLMPLRAVQLDASAKMPVSVT